MKLSATIFNRDFWKEDFPNSKTSRKILKRELSRARRRDCKAAVCEAVALAEKD
jgi:hypothetical protein